VFYVSDWEERRRAAERMGRTADEFCGWPLAYQQEAAGSLRWTWTAGERWPSTPLAGHVA